MPRISSRSACMHHSLRGWWYQLAFFMSVVLIFISHTMFSKSCCSFISPTNPSTYPLLLLISRMHSVSTSNVQVDVSTSSLQVDISRGGRGCTACLGTACHLAIWTRCHLLQQLSFVTFFEHLWIHGKAGSSLAWMHGLPGYGLPPCELTRCGILEYLWRNGKEGSS